MKTWWKLLVLTFASAYTAVTACGSGVVINEFMARNDGAYTNAAGQCDDWIELHNTTGADVDLAGWYLTDSLNNPVRWRFPEGNAPLTTVPAGGFLLVFASGSDEPIVSGELHCSFGLDGSGEYLALVEPDGATVAYAYNQYEYSPGEWGYPPQDEDKSYGIIPGSSELCSFEAPTPGMPNTPSTPVPQFSHPSRAYTAGFSLVLTNEMPAATIYYTLDGSMPTTGSPSYTPGVPIAIPDNSSTLVRAAAKAPGMLISPVVSECYFMLDSTLADFSSDLPIILLETFGYDHEALPRNKIWRTAYMLVIEPNESGRAAITDPPAFAGRSGAHARGTTSLTRPKVNLRVETWDEHDRDKDASILGFPSDSDWVLLGPYQAYASDVTLGNAVFAHRLYTATGHYSSRNRYCEMFMNSDSDRFELEGGADNYSTRDYHGIYVFLESIRRGADRIDVERLDPEDKAAPDITGGYIVCANDNPPEWDFLAGSLSWCYVYPQLESMTTTHVDQDAWLKSYLNDCWTAVDNASVSKTYTEYLDMDSWINYHIFTAFSQYGDAFNRSTYYYKKRGGKLAVGPAWDLDSCYANNSTAGWSGFSTCGARLGFEELWWREMFDDADCWQQWIDHYFELRRGPMSATNMVAILNNMSNEVWEAHFRNTERWVGSTYPNFQNWLRERAAWCDSQFLPVPELNRNGGPVASGFQVAITNIAAGRKSYYTLDGTDPRAPGGAIAGTEYNGPVTLSANTVMKSRTYDASWTITYPTRVESSNTDSIPWSAPAEAVFIVTTARVAVTEIMYHPRDPRAGTTETNFTAGDFEFIELKNTGTEPASLLGIEFTDGITFDFTYGNITTLGVGDYVVAVRNLAAFTNRYANWAEINIAGEFEGSLNDDGENIRLEYSALGSVMFDFVYDDDWYPCTDGDGFSLVIVESSMDEPLDYWQSWRASAFIDGSPGAADPEPGGSVVINEVGAHTDTGLDPPYDSDDWIELYNPLGVAVDIGGWYLSDSAENLKRYRIPDGTTIEAGGYLLLTEDLDFHTNRLDGSGFGLDKAGESVFLSHLPGTSADRVADVVRFEGQENGPSLGRYPDGGEYWYALSPTPDAPNAPPGPRVYISEIMYNPPDSGATPANNTRDEYIKIRNPLGTAVDLWTDAGAWCIDGGVRYTFPGGTTIGAGESLYLVSFDTDEVAERDGFLAAYGLTNGQFRLFGPYDGKLANEGERVALERPQAPDLAGEDVSWVIVDEAVYFAQSPWPADPDGVGRGIVRVDAVGSGNDPDNWEAPEPSLLLALHWKLDESSGAAAGDSGWYGRHGALRDIQPGNGDANTPPLWTEGKLGNALEFDGVDDVVRFDGKAVKEFPFTLTAWVKTSSGTGVRCAIYVGESGRDYRYYCIGVNGGKGEIAGHVSDNPRARLSARGATSIADGQWHHLAGVFKSPTQKVLYVDGVPEAVLTMELVYTNSVDRCSAGLCDRPSADGAWLGELDDVRVYNAELTEDGIHTLAEEVPGTADEDGDGLPDAWERQYFGGTNAVNGGRLDDWDLDGLNNEGEYAAGTDPTNALSVFRVLIGASNGLPVVWFTTLEAEGDGYEGLERYYDLERRTNLLEGGWTGLVPYVDILGSGVPVVFTNEAPSGRTFYRGKVRLQPGGP